jgi:Ca2+-transporting ATPase
MSIGKSKNDSVDKRASSKGVMPARSLSSKESRSPSPSSSSSRVNELLRDSREDTKMLLRGMNHAQALNQNLQALRELGGAAALAKNQLLTSMDDGIDLRTVETRRELYGENALPSSPRKSFWQLFVGTFDDATLQILMVAAVVSLAIGIYEDPIMGYVEGCAIITACTIVSVVTAANDYQKESQFREFSAVNDEVDVVVIRDITHWQIPVSEIVVGDIVCLEEGDQIPCDGILLQADFM